MIREDEQRIIRMLKQGENSAYKYIYDHHYALLCAVAREYLKDTFLATNIVDDLIFHLWEKRETLEINTSLRSYLIRSVRNRCINHLNLEREKRELSFTSIDRQQKELIEHSEAIDYPLATLLEKELEREIMQAVESLPEECWKVFRMSRWEEKRVSGDCPWQG